MTTAILLTGVAFALAADGAAGTEETMAKGTGKGWIELKGGPFVADATGAKTGPREQSRRRRHRHGGDVLAFDVDLPTRGVWYAWLKVSSEGLWPAVLTWEVDGAQPLLSARREILVQPWARSVWVNHTRFPGFKIEVHVDAPGRHTLKFRRLSGNVTVEKVLLTLHHSAKLAGDGLDMSDDPGRGRIAFPHTGLESTGARADYRSPKPAARGFVCYVDSEKGSDEAAGTAPGKAWKTLGRVNSRNMKPGDTVFLKRGGRWSESLHPKGSGSAERPIVVAAYGEGDRPLLNGVNRAGVDLLDQSFWTIQDIAATSDPEYRTDAIAVRVSEKAARPRGIRILNCHAFDSGRHGISVGGYAGTDGVLIENCTAFCNLGDGIETGGSTAKSARNTVIRRCTAWSNPGMAGIWINGTENGLIEDCLAYNNACVNIWVWNATNVTMRRCEAFRGRPQRDAAGFDIDWGSQACTMEYCYSHHNEGDAFLLMGSGNVDYLGCSKKSAFNIMRYCVAEGASTIDMGETFNDCLVYNNVSIALGKGAHAFKVFGWPNDANNDGGGWPERTRVVNNIFVAVDGAVGMYVDDHGTEQGNDYDGNLFWRVNSKAPLIRWGGRSSGPDFWTGNRDKGTFPPKDYRTLEDFRKATGKGFASIEADPKLANPGTGEYGRVPLDGYAPRPGSPAIGAGVRIPITEEWLRGRRAFLSDTGAKEWGIPMEPAESTVDYSGAPLGPQPSLGVREGPAR